MYYDNLTIKLLKSIGKNIEEVSNELKISERTIRYRIKDLNTNFSLQDNSLYIEKKIIKFKGDISSLQKILEKEEYIFNSEERIELILLLLLFNSEGYKADKILDILAISRSTLKSDLKVIRSIFNSKKIELTSKANKGLIVSGEELEIRKLLLDKLRSYYVIKREKLEIVSNFNAIKKEIIESFISKELIERVSIFFEKIKIELKKKISDEAFQIIYIYILITLRRIEVGLKLSKSQNSQFIKSTEDYRIIKKNIIILENENLKIIEEEILKITEFILGAHTYNFNYSFYENWILIEKFIDNLIYRMSKKIEKNLIEDKILREGLINHIVPTIYRLKNNLELQESISSEIKEEYPQYYYYIKEFVKELENYIGKDFSENELAFLVVHFILAIKRLDEKIQNHKRAVIVCGLGYGTSNLLKQEIEELFDIEIKDVIPLNNLKDIELLDIDYIISTIEIKEEKIKIPIIKVNTFLKKEDIVNLLNHGIKNKKTNIEVDEIIKIIEECTDIKDKKLLKEKLVNYTSKKEKIENQVVSKKLNPDYKPSSETEMHLSAYRSREDFSAFIHTHAMYCTTIACLRESLKAVDYMLAITGTNEVKCAEYATFGTPELAKNATEAIRGAKACLLANHGVNVGAEDIENAFAITEYVEFCAELYVKAKAIGEPVILSKEEIDKHIEKFGSYCKL